MEIGTLIHRFSSCSSTNDLAREMAERGEPEGAVVLCEEQTAGRGTKGRTWFSAPNRGFYASVILRPRSPDLSFIPLLAGVAVVEAVERIFGLRAGLKWPNDVVWQGKKLGGILVESVFTGAEADFVILGIGLNLNHEAPDFPLDIRAIATSLRIILKKPVPLESLLSGLWKSLENWYRLLDREGERRILRGFELYSSIPIGTIVIIRTPASEIRGVYSGLDARGGLVLEVDGRKTSFYSAEIVAVDPE